MKLTAAVIASLAIGAMTAFVAVVAYTTWAFVDAVSD